METNSLSHDQDVDLGVTSQKGKKLNKQLDSVSENCLWTTVPLQWVQKGNQAGNRAGRHRLGRKAADFRLV